MPAKFIGLKGSRRAHQDVLTTFKQRDKTRSLRAP